MPYGRDKMYHFQSDETTQLPKAISRPRFGRYLNACNGDAVAALQLYQWNLQISSAFLLPLQMLEVTVRNAVAEVIEAAYGPNWTHSCAFMFSLPSSGKTFNSKQHLRNTSEKHTIPSKVIADLKFIFWQKMFVRNFDSVLWNTHLRTAFPYVASHRTVQQLRAEFHDSLETLRILRNRVAHHEPIFERNLRDDLNLIDTLIGYRCRHTANWMRRIEQVSTLLAHRPSASAPQAQSAQGCFSQRKSRAWARLFLMCLCPFGRRTAPAGSQGSLTSAR